MHLPQMVPARNEGIAGNADGYLPVTKSLRQTGGSELIKTLTLGTALAMALILAGCGTNPGDRTASGALLGAGAGAVIGAAAGNPAAGAAIGAAAGAVTGAATDPCKLNLGDPVWHNDEHAYERRCGHPPR
jgi:osmotically inducible lipoprotein OsmB